MSSHNEKHASETSGASAEKKQKKLVYNTLESKIEMLDYIAKSGESNVKVAMRFGVTESAVRYAKKNEAKLRKSLAEGLSKHKTVRGPRSKKMEKALYLWVLDMQKKSIPISSLLLREKAKDIEEKMKNEEDEYPETSFIASRGWFQRFKNRYGLHNVKFTGEAVSADSDATVKFKEEFLGIIAGGGYSPKQVFKADETGLHCKCLPSRTFITKVEQSAPGKSQIPASWSAKDFGEEAVKTNIPMTQGLCEAYPPPAQDPQDSSEVYTIDSSSIMDSGSVAEEAEFPMTLKTPAKSPSPTQDPLQQSELYTIDGSDGNVAEEAEFPMTLETLAKSPSPTQDPLQPKQIQMQHKNHFTNVMEALAGDEAFVDVTLTAEGRAIRAHKLVLSAVSPYFQQVLRDNPCRHPIIIMPYHVQFDHLTHIVEYMYKGEITIAEDQVEPVLKTAKLLQVTGLAASDSAELITENSLCTAPEMNHPPTRSSIMTNHQSCSSGGTLPLISTSKVTVLENDSHKVSKPFYRSSIRVRSPTVSVATPSENTSTQVNICKMANTLISSRAVDSEALRGSTSSTFTRISGVPVNISRPVSAESSINDSPILESLSDTEIDFVKEEEDLTEDKEENVELMMVDYTPQQASRRDPLRTYQKPRKSHTALPNRDILPDNTNLSTPDPFICPYCEEQHMDINKMKVHLNRKHPFKPKFICGCGRIFVRPIQHQVHTKLCPSSS